MTGDWKIHYPFTLGFEFAGIVESFLMKDAEPTIAVGDNVCGVTSIDSRHGAFAEYILYPIDQLCRIPRGVSMKEAAGIGVAGLTAFQLLFTSVTITSKSKILILGATSVVGSLAIQLAKITGSWVSTTCNARSMKYVMQFGADEVMNDEEHEWAHPDKLTEFDVVIDARAEQDCYSQALERSIIYKDSVLAINATRVLDTQVDDPKSILLLSGLHPFTYNHIQLNHLLNLLAHGKLRIPIDRQFPFSEEGVRSLILYQQRKSFLGKNLLLFDYLATYHGSCSCGGITFEVVGRPQASLICHCSPCQKLLSGFFSSFCLYPCIDITKGQELIISYGSPLSLSRSHFFCRVCGSCLYMKHPGTDMMAILMFAFDDLPFCPTAHVNYSQRRLSIYDELPKSSEWLDQSQIVDRSN